MSVNSALTLVRTEVRRQAKLNLLRGTGVFAGTIFREPYPDWLLFASSSAVENLINLLGPEPLRNISIATIGPATSQTVAKHGLTIRIEATVHTVPGLVEAVVSRY